MNKGTKAILIQAGLGKNVDRVNKGICPTCNRKINPQHFKDPLSFKEFTISGMCQKCQDEVFGTRGEM